MKIVLAPDSFKECLSAEEVCQAIKKGIRKVLPRAKIVSVPMADGGEGTALAIVKGRKGTFRTCIARGPLLDKVKACYGLIDGGNTAIIEMAQASGLHLVPRNKRNPLKTTSFGTGELIRDALDRGVKKIILALGGVATNDAGAGIAQALDCKLLDKKNKQIGPGAESLNTLDRITPFGLHPRLKEVKFIAANDVKNPLCGPNGSAAVYGPQKGATPKMVRQIDSALRHFSDIVKRDLGINIKNFPGGGAAGGAGAGAKAFLNAEFESGVELVIEYVRLEEAIIGADLVITGEGKIDRSTLYGKTVKGVSKIAKKHHVPVIALCGKMGNDSEKLHFLGVTSIFPIASGPMTYEESLRNASDLIQKKTEQIFNLIISLNKN